MLELFASPQSWIAIATLALLEIVLGIDNLVFIAIITGRLPAESQPKARKIGLGVALATRLVLLFALSWIMGLTRPLFEFHAFGHLVELTGRSLILLAGGLFLIYKATTEIRHKVELVDEDVHTSGKAAVSFGAVIANIAVMDMVFSLDSVITAVGMVDHIELMVVGVIIAMIVMVAFADAVSAFVQDNPSIKILALSFLLMIGVLLTAEAFEVTVPKGYVYFAMAFSLTVELIEMRYDKNLASRAA